MLLAMKQDMCVLRAGGVIALILAMSGCASSSSRAQKSDTAEPVRRVVSSEAAESADVQLMIAQYREDRSSISRFFNITWSENRMARLDELAASQLEELSRLDFGKLDQAAKVDAIAFRNYLRNSRSYGALEKSRMAEMSALMPFRTQIVELEESRWRMERTEPKSAAEKIEEIAMLAKDAKAALERKEGVPTASTALRLAGAVQSLRWNLSQFVEYSNGYVPEFSWWVKKPWENANAALNDYAKYLRENVAGQKGNADDPLVGDPIGRATLMEDLKNEMVVYTPEELIAIGDKEFAWCEAEMKRASAEMGFGDDWKKALESVKDGHVAPGGQADMVSAKSKAAIAFVKEHDLVTVPPLAEELWRLQMLSPQGQKTLPFAAYGDQAMLVAYPTDDMSTADKLMAMRGNNKHFLHIVVPHELIPGHHLQHFVAERNRPYRGLFSTPFYVEGWALYWEFKLWDMGWGATPQDRIGMLFWRMHRCARIMVSLKFHLGEMTPQQMIDFLVDRVGHERQNATAEVRRFIGGGYSPLYQCGYMIGGKALRRLHEEAVKDGKMGEKEFNDAVLRGNSIPIELVRSGILGTELEWTSEAAWRFAD